MIRSIALASALCLAAPAAAAPFRATTAERDWPDLRITSVERDAYRAYNREVTDKNPRLAQVLSDPDRFVADLEGRFEAQKAKTPDDPYGFDFSDYGLPVLQSLKGQLAGKIEKVQAQLDKLESASAPMRFAHRAQIAEHKAGLQYLAVLGHEIASHLDQGTIGYRRLIELSYFSARAMGHFDLGDLTLKDRAMLQVDRYMQGYRSTSIAEEQAHFADGKFSVFQADSPVGGFKPVQKPFEQAFFDKEKLSMIALPTTLDLSGAELMRLVPYNVFLLGVTDKPFPADGFVRPGGDFWLHDIRHSSAIFGKRQAYEAEHGLDEARSAKLQKKMDVWALDLETARAQVQDKDLGAAIDLLVFNSHHDRGLPIAPSSYLTEKVDLAPRALYATYRVAGQSTAFKNPGQTMDRAYAWLKAFWLPRLNEEKALWGPSGS